MYINALYIGAPGAFPIIHAKNIAATRGNCAVYCHYCSYRRNPRIRAVVKERPK